MRNRRFRRSIPRRALDYQEAPGRRSLESQYVPTRAAARIQLNFAGTLAGLQLCLQYFYCRLHERPHLEGRVPLNFNSG